jgi:hypothetical protein
VPIIISETLRMFVTDCLLPALHAVATLALGHGSLCGGAI